MEGSDYIERLGSTLERYRPETVAKIGHWCRSGYVSHQKAAEFVELLEADRRATDSEMQGMERPEWYDALEGAEDMDRVFGASIPGAIGGVACRPSSLDWE